jgi:SAM-dependent methyltransferase
MSVDYNKFAKTFSNSRKKMKWEEIDYFLSFLEWKKDLDILDIWCGNGRFLWVLKEKNINFKKYLGVDLSKWLLDEAKKIYPKNDFLELNMLDLDKVKWQKFDYIFFIASFHHLENFEYRLEVITKLKWLLKKDWTVFMTNWALNSELNHEKYGKSIINWSENDFWSLDYMIKIWEHNRYYHCFDLKELEYLFTETWFEIIENREFENKRNFVSIIQKKWD